MKKLFEKFCIPLMLINNNVYTFISGILLSLSTGIITTFCLEKTPFSESWHMYASSVIYTALSAMLIYIASQVTSYQNYFLANRTTILESCDKKEVIKDHESHRSTFWVVFFLISHILLIAGTVLLFLNYVL